MSQMFRDCRGLTSLDLTHDNFDTSNVLTMSEMFYGCISLTTLDLTHDNFDTHTVQNMNRMFSSCSSLTSLDLTHDNFDTHNVTIMAEMFYSCRGLTSLDLTHDNFDTSNVQYMNAMFKACSGLTSLDLTHDNFNTSKVLSMDGMFSGCTALSSLDLTHDNFDTSKVRNMGGMFCNCDNLTALDLSTWNVSAVRLFAGDCSVNGGIQRGMFEACNRLVTLDLRNWDTASAIDIQRMFYNNQMLKTIYASNTFDTSNLSTRLEGNTTYVCDANMFYNCTSINGGSGTTYNSNYVNKEYARLDGVNGLHGYFYNVVTYNVDYDANTTDAVTNMPVSQIKTYGVALTLSSNTPVRSGYIFKGWSNTSGASNTVDYAAGATYTANAQRTLCSMGSNRCFWNYCYKIWYRTIKIK